MIRQWNEESLDHRNTLLYAMGISEEDAKRPVIGLINSWNEMNPGHFPFDKSVIQEMKEEIYKAGGLALELPVSGVCDGICSNTPGDRYTLPARDLVSSEVETVAELNMLEGMVLIARYADGSPQGEYSYGYVYRRIYGCRKIQGAYAYFNTYQTGICSLCRRKDYKRGV